MFVTLFNLNEDFQTDISICIPTYKRVDSLIRTLSSLLNQDLKINIEILISANAPLNIKVINFLNKNFSTNVNFKLRVYEQSNNIGLYGNWNFLIDNASSEWITILNDDDILSSKWLNYANEFIGSSISSSKSLYAPSIEMFGPKKPESNSSDLNKLIKKIRFFGSNVIKVTLFDILHRTILGGALNIVFNKDCASKIRFYDKRDYPSADYLFIAEYIQKFGGYRDIRIGGYYNWDHNDSLKKNRKVKFLLQSYKIRQKIIYEECKKNWLFYKYLSLGNYIHLYLSYFNYRYEDPSLRIKSLEQRFFQKKIGISIIPNKILRIILRIIYLPSNLKQIK